MTDLKVLDELQRLSKAATPGPWREGTKNVWNDGILRCVLSTERGRHREGRYRLRRDDSESLEQTDCQLVAALRNSADSLIADSRRLQKIEAAAQEILTVADLRGDSSLPHPSRDAKLWTARMQTAWDELREALEDCGAGEVEEESCRN